jgi:hypothetical protein
MPYLLFSPIGVFKGDIQDILDIISSVFLQGFLRRYQRYIIPPHIFPLGFGEVIRI